MLNILTDIRGEELRQFLLWISPLLFIFIAIISLSVEKSLQSKTHSFLFSLFFSLLIGTFFGLIEVNSKGWHQVTSWTPLFLLFIPVFIIKWAFVTYSIIWPFQVYTGRTSNKAVIKVAHVVIFIGLTFLVFDIGLKPYYSSVEMNDLSYWESFFKNNEINRPKAEIGKRLLKTDPFLLSQYLPSGRITTSESLYLITDICMDKETINNEQSKQRACDIIISNLLGNPNMDRELVDRLLSIKRKTDNYKYPTYACAMASNLSTPVDILERLYRTEREMPAGCFAMNENTPIDILQAISADNQGSNKHAKRNAQRTLERIKLSSMSDRIIKKALLAARKNSIEEARDILIKAREYRDNMTAETSIYFGLLSCMLGNYDDAMLAYDNAEHTSIDIYGYYNKDYFRISVAVLLLKGLYGDADNLVNKFAAWYPFKSKIQMFITRYPDIKQTLTQFAVTKKNHPLTTPASLEKVLSLQLFDETIELNQKSLHPR